MAATLLCPQVLQAEAFTGESLLNWSESDQIGYISAQLVMASTIASRSMPEMVDCIADTFFDGAGMSDVKFAEIVQTIGE